MRTRTARRAAPALAATGTEASVGLIAGAGALVLGLGAIVLAQRRVAANR